MPHVIGFFQEIFPVFPVLFPKCFGRTDFNRKNFGISNFRDRFFFIFQLSTGNFSGFLHFEPKKIPENSGTRELSPK
jgi:hypothetical protein